MMVLTIDSVSDAVTSAALAFREPGLYSRIPVTQLVRRQGAQAVRASVTPVTQAPGLDAIIGVGHGTGLAFHGNDSLPVFTVDGYQAVEVLGRGVHLTSCSTAQALGADMVRRGARFFLGYIQDLLFYAQIANLVFDADAEIDRALVSGQTAGQAQQRALARFDHYIAVLARRRASQVLVQQMIYNRNILRGPLSDAAYGDSNVTL